MNPLKVIIDNWPNESWYIKHIPTAIAIFALIISIFSLYWGRKQFEESKRPYVWLMNFGSLSDKMLIINHPDTVMMKVENAPAFIKSIKYEFYYTYNSNKQLFHSYHDSSLVRFPTSANMQYTYSVPEFTKELQKLPKGSKLERYVRTDYSNLSGSGKYYYESYSEYIPTENRWKEYSEKAL